MKAVRFELMEFGDGYGCSHIDDVSGIYYPAADVDAYRRKVAALVESLIARMDRARTILTNGNPTGNQNWGMLDTIYDKASLAALEGPENE